jgi:hypothetical protein
MNMARRAKRISKERSCDGKKKLNQTEAIGLANALKRKTGAIVRAYRCKFRCKLEDNSVAWHVGHTRIRKQ